MEQGHTEDIPVPNPKNPAWSGQFLGKFLGSIWQSWNIDLERSQGKVATAERMLVNLDSGAQANLGAPYHALRADADRTDRWWYITAGSLWNSANATPQSSISIDALSGTPSGAQDAIVHMKGTNTSTHDRLIVALATDLAILNLTGIDPISSGWVTNWWSGTLGQNTTSANTLVSTAPIILARLESIPMLAVCNGNLVHTIDASDNVSASRIILPNNYVVTNVVVSQNRFWFLAKHTFSGRGLIVDWDGSSVKANDYFYVDGTPIMGGVSTLDVPYMVLDNGCLLEYNGSGFKIINHFPNFEEKCWFDSINSSYKHCAATDGDMLYFLLPQPRDLSQVGSSTAQSIRMRGGIWCFNTTTGDLYHRYSLSATRVADSTPYDYGQSSFANGQIASSAINTGFIVNTYPGNINSGNGAPKFLLGGRVIYDYNTPTVRNVVGYTSEQVQRSYIITSEIPAQDVENFWSVLWLRFNKFLDSSYSIVTKYRVTDGIINSNLLALESTGTWAGSGLPYFTSTVPSGVAIGNEVEILAGANAGFNAHITGFLKVSDGSIVITPDGSTNLRVTLDETPPNTATTNTCLVRYEDWVKVLTNNPITTTNSVRSNSIDQIVGGQSASQGVYIQYKIELRGKRMMLNQLRSIGDVMINTEQK